jgi:hypothetical protein
LCLAKKVDQDYESVRQLVLLEDFKNCVHSDILTYLDEHKLETFKNSARAADEYSLAHKVPFVDTSSTQQSSGQKVVQLNTSHSKSQSGTTFRNQASNKLDQKSLSLPTCTYCNKKDTLFLIASN